MLLIITNSTDGTINRLLAYIEVPVFRFNFDLWNEYEVAYKITGWEIKSPAGFFISDETVTRVFWWKAFNTNLDLDPLLTADIKCVYREIYNSCVHKGKG
jgi:hypothetical protein